MTNILTNKARHYITIGVMILAAVRAMDMTIINVVLPHMIVSLDANSNQITWVLTSYMTATAAATPLLGFLAERYGRKRLLITSTVGFIIASLGCGLSPNLAVMVFFRILQGAFGAALNPIAQSVLIDSYPKNKSRVAMSIYGIAVITAPILAPLFGAYVTDFFNWRWLFLINVPLCLFGLAIASKHLDETPKRATYINWMDIYLIIAGIAAFQLVIDRGNDVDWFQASSIQLLTCICVITLVTFFIRQFNNQNQVINFDLFKDRIFSISFILTIIFFIGVMAKFVALPLMLSELFAYPITYCALVLVPLGVASMLGMIISAKLMKKYEGTSLLFFGALLGIASSYYMTNLNLSASLYHFIIPNILQGLSIGLFFTPLSSYAYRNLPPHLTDQASAMLNFARNLGSSVGITIASTIIYRKQQIHWQQLIATVNDNNANLADMINYHHLSLQDPKHLALLGQMIMQQASMFAFVEAYLFTGICFVLTLLLMVFLKKNH